MPRTASFDLSEIKTTSPKDPQPKYRSNLNSHATRNVSQETKPTDEKCCQCSCGWIVGLFLSACSFAFLVLLFLFPEQFVSRFIIIERERHLLVQKGYLRAYPNLPERSVEPNDRVPGVYVIDPSSKYIKTEIVPSIEGVLKNYTDVESNNYPPNPYVLCWLENALRSETPCFFDKNWILKDCTKENDFGYKSNQGLYSPCVLLRLEETEDWVPQIFKLKDVNPMWIKQYDASHFSVGCYPSVTEEREHRQLEVKIYPNKGFPIHFFPQRFYHQELYLSPMVMVQFIDLEVERDYSIECWIYAKNSWFLKDSGVVQIHFRHESNRNKISNGPSYFEDDINNITEVQSHIKDNSSSFRVHRPWQN